MKKIILFTILAVCFNTIFAEPITIETAKTVAKNFMTQASNGSIISIKSVETESYNNQPSYYVINFSPSGWVMVSANNAVWPILGHSTTDAFEFNEYSRPPALNYLLSDYKQQIATAATSHLKSNNDSITAAWDRWTTTSRLKAGTDYTPGSFLLKANGQEIKWGQDYSNEGKVCIDNSYHKYCPTGSGGDCICGKTSVGCGPLAMGMIMRYWQWPRSYNWGNMPTEIGKSTPPNQADSIAQFLRNCGLKTNAAYLCVGTWVYTSDIINAFKNSFGYKGVSNYDRTNFFQKVCPDDIWRQLLRNEIDNKRPILYYGENNPFSAKHYFVLDGYSKIDYNQFHVNFGKIGTNNDYYYISDINYGTTNYNSRQEAIIGISPSCSGLPIDITSVSYTSVNDVKKEAALRSIVLPASNSTLTVNNGGNLNWSGGTVLQMKPGFTVKPGGSFKTMITNNADFCNDCGLQFTAMNNALIQGADGYNGKLVLKAVNANTYEIAISNSNYIYYFGVGKLESNVPTIVWDGTGVPNQGVAVYTVDVVLRNNCGESLHITRDVTVLNSTKSGLDSVSNKLVFPNEILSITASQEITSSSGFVLYPNPSEDFLGIRTTPTNLPYSISIINTLGQVVYHTDEINSDDFQYKLPDCLEKYCTVEIIANKKKYYHKLIIK